MTQSTLTLKGDSALLSGDFLLPAMLSATAGAADAVGFLGLGGVFTADITGNLVIAAAHFSTGRFSKSSPLLGA